VSDSDRPIPEPAAPDVDAWGLLMKQAQDGDRAAYAILLAELTPYLRGVARRYLRMAEDAEDAVQEILLSLHAARATYDPARPFRPWVVALARRRIIDQMRRQGRRKVEISLDLDDETFPGPDANKEIEARDGVRVLDRALARLAPGQRQAVELLKIRELSLAEASRITGLTEGALKVAVHRGLKALRTLWKAD
jgi:RNA polymerase sigma-70 factor (ECF subfamily)